MKISELNKLQLGSIVYFSRVFKYNCILCKFRGNNREGSTTDFAYIYNEV